MRGTARGRAQHIGRSRRINDSESSGWLALWAPTAALLMLLLMLLLMMVGSVQTADAAPADASSGSIHIVVPTPQTDGKTAQGPVGTNVSISGGQATANATYNLGWVPQTTGCSGQVTPFADTPSVTADDGGNFRATFAWPDAAGSTGALYLICASDSANPTDVITTDQAFQVLGASAPAITLSQAPSSKHSGEKFDAGGPVQAQGSGFLPQGTPIAIFVTSRATFSAQDYQPGNALKTVDGSPIVSDGQGQFSAIVTLPSLMTGSLFLHAVSTDAVASGQPGFPPSLSATSNIQVNTPQPTPTVQPSPTPKPSGATTTKDTNTTNTGRIIAIATLGVLSIILFIIGGILIASAAVGPRTPPTLDSGTRAQPTPVRTDSGW